MKQPQKTLVYAKALQYWVEKAQPPLPGEPCQLAESMLVLQQAREPLTVFTDAEVLEDAPPSHWVKITSCWTSEPMDPQPLGNEATTGAIGLGPEVHSWQPMV